MKRNSILPALRERFLLEAGQIRNMLKGVVSRRTKGNAPPVLKEEGHKKKKHKHRVVAETGLPKEVGN